MPTCAPIYSLNKVEYSVTIMDEELLGIAPTEGARFRLNPLARKMGKYALFFTTDRLMVVKLSGIKTVLAEGFLGPLGNLYSNLTSRKLKDLTGMSLDEVLKSDKDNSIIPYSEIVKVTMGKGKIVETWGTIILSLIHISEPTRPY